MRKTARPAPDPRSAAPRVPGAGRAAESGAPFVHGGAGNSKKPKRLAMGGTPDLILSMMESQVIHAGEVLWADVMRDAVAYFREMVASNKLEKWRPKQ